LLDYNAVKALLTGELLKWYELSSNFRDEIMVMKEVQSQIKVHLKKGLDESGIKANSETDGPALLMYEPLLFP
jgi:hypothetical protein